MGVAGVFKVELVLAITIIIARVPMRKKGSNIFFIKTYADYNL